MKETVIQSLVLRPHLYRLFVFVATLLFLAGPAAAGISGDTGQCFVEGLMHQIDIHPDDQQNSAKNDSAMFSNTVTTPVTVTCPLNVHPALDIDGAVVKVIRLKRTLHLPVADKATAGFSCALMTRSADGGQATGRRVTRTRAGLIYLPETDQATTATIGSNEARYRYIQCDLPGYSAITHFSTEVAVSEAASKERIKLLEALDDAELNLPGLPRLNDDFARTGNQRDASIGGEIPLIETPSSDN